MVTDLNQLLNVVRAPDETAANSFLGPAHPTDTGRSFGGQIMAQAVLAAGATVAPDRQLHSLHGYFVRPGMAAESVRFAVDQIFDGGSFSTRRAQGFQSDQAIMSLIASFQKPTQGMEFTPQLDITTIPEPAAVPPLESIYQTFLPEKNTTALNARPFEFRYLDPEIFSAPQQPKQVFRSWIRAKTPIGSEQLLNRAALAFGSDYLYVESALRATGLYWRTPGLRLASLDLAMWFHTDVNVNEWLLYELECSYAKGSRALVQGKFYSQKGELLASCTQEVLMRVAPEVLEEAK